MPCFHPLQAWRPKSGTKPVFHVSQGWADRPLKLPCGQCVGCRLERSRVWAVRCVHEAQMHEQNCFITLTYSDEMLPAGRTLVLEHFQKFFKRLRKKYGAGIRFFHCGEYGDRFGRPHYHACIFGLDFADKVPFRENANGDVVYTSAALASLWCCPDTGVSYGHSSCGEVTFQSAAYVARYVMKKQTGPNAETHYEFIDGETGEVFDRKPEYVTMSRRPGIGRDWYDKFRGDVFPLDFVVMNGKKFRPPRFYDKAYEVEFPSDFKRLKGKRIRKAAKHAANNTPDRLRVRESIQVRKLEQLKRSVG